MPKDTPSRSRWLQFSTRTLLALMLLTAGYGAGWATASRRAAEAEQRARTEAVRAMRMAEEARMQAERAAAAANYQRALAAAAAAALRNGQEAEVAK